MDIRGGRPFLCPSGKEELDMSISKFNSEGYHDPTAYDALSSIENEARALRAFRPIVYICCQNVQPLCCGTRIHSYRTTPAVSTVFR